MYVDRALGAFGSDILDCDFDDMDGDVAAALHEIAVNGKIDTRAIFRSSDPYNGAECLRGKLSRPPVSWETKSVAPPAPSPPPMVVKENDVRQPGRFLACMVDEHGGMDGEVYFGRQSGFCIFTASYVSEELRSVVRCMFQSLGEVEAVLGRYEYSLDENSRALQQFRSAFQLQKVILDG